MSKSAKNEDTVSDEYPYYWSEGRSGLSIEEFVAKYKPSMVQDDGTKPWLWVKNSNTSGDDGKREGAIEEAKKLLAEVTEKVEKIKTDETIPTRSNKKTGAKSKKELREQVQAEASDRLKEIHKRHNYISGKWLAFVPPDKVDSIWSRLAISVTTGSLSETYVNLAKVATSPMNESQAQRLICVYVPDVFDEPKVTEVMKILLRNHGINLSGVKSNLYTDIGLDSKHPSGIQSTVWKNAALMKDQEIKDLKEAFFAGLKSEQEKDVGAKAKKIIGKPKTGQDDPFGSDEDDDEDRTGKAAPKSKPKPVTDDPFGSSDEDEKPKAKAKPAKSAAPKRRKEDGDEDDEGEKPKKKAQKKR